MATFTVLAGRSGGRRSGVPYAHLRVWGAGGEVMRLDLLHYGAFHEFERDVSRRALGWCAASRLDLQRGLKQLPAALAFPLSEADLYRWALAGEQTLSLADKTDADKTDSDASKEGGPLLSICNVSHNGENL